MRIELINIQSIEHAIYDLEEKGITQIIGDNSNGKSILIKACSFVTSNHIKDKEERETIIRDGSNTGSIIMSRNGVILTVYITRERDNNRYTLQRATGEIITRTIREGGLDILADEFGWIVFDDNICLQIFETFGIMPFVNNREAGDYDIIDYIITDKIANNFVDYYETITYPAFKEYVSGLNATISTSKKNLESITFYDIPKYEDSLYKLKKYQRNLAYLKTYEFSKLPITKAFKYIDINQYLPTRLPLYKVAPVAPLVLSLYQILTDLYNTAMGVCPTCGLSLIDTEDLNEV